SRTAASPSGGPRTGTCWRGGSPRADAALGSSSRAAPADARAAAVVSPRPSPLPRAVLGFVHPPGPGALSSLAPERWRNGGAAGPCRGPGPRDRPRGGSRAARPCRYGDPATTAPRRETMAKIVVTGGGIVGLSAAMLLARDGHQVTVLERDPTEPPSPEDAWEQWSRT